MSLLRRTPVLLATSLVVGLVVIGATAQRPSAQVDPLIAGFKKTYPASVSDAVELVTGKNGTMWHDMKLVNGTPMVGRAVTSLVRPAPPEQATPALSTKHSVEMIDSAKPGEVGVIVMEGTLDIAAMGNLMATAAKVLRPLSRILLPSVCVWNFATRTGARTPGRIAPEANAVPDHKRKNNPLSANPIKRSRS